MDEKEAREMKTEYHGVEFTIGGKTIDMSKAIVGIDFARSQDSDRSAVTLGKIDGGICYTATAEISGVDFDRIMSLFAPSKPRWGQPGRRRRRAMRLEARRINEIRTKLNRLAELGQMKEALELALANRSDGALRRFARGG